MNKKVVSDYLNKTPGADVGDFMFIFPEIRVKEVAHAVQKRIYRVKSTRSMNNLSYIMAFVMGVILFTSFWRGLFGFASSPVVLAGMAGVAVTVTVFWLQQKIKHNSKEE